MPPTPSPASAGVGSIPKRRMSTTTPTTITMKSTTRRARRRSDAAPPTPAAPVRRRMCRSMTPFPRITSQTTAVIVITAATLDQNWRTSSGAGRLERNH